jgi:hypothetical protein
LSSQGVDPGLWWRLRYIVDPPRARVYRATDQAIPTGVSTAIAFSAYRYKVGDVWTAAAPTRLVAPVSGLYALTAGLRWESSAAGARRQALFRVNGATIVRVHEYGPQLLGTLPHQPLADEYELAAGDYVELMVLQDTGANLNIFANGNWSPELTFRRVVDRA